MCVLYRDLTVVFFNQALPFLLKNLVTPEINEINAFLTQNKIKKPKVVDPSPKVQLVMEAFKDFYNHLRQPMLTTQDLKDLATKTVKLQWICKEVFPSKSGLTVCVLITECTHNTQFLCVDYTYTNPTFGGV